MKIKHIATLSILSFAAFGVFAKSDKRGVSENSFLLCSQLEALEPGVTWFYTWGNAMDEGSYDGIDQYEGLEFVPMCWSGSFSAEKIRKYCKSHPQTKYLLGFNEPNFKDQANMTPQQAAEKWPEVQALAKELNLKLVAPVLNYSPNPPYTDPLKWMDEFVALVGLDAFDYTAIHNYGGLGVMKKLAGDFHDRYGKDVWVTEFCLWPNAGDNNSTVKPENQIRSMVETLEWLETTEWIFRYAWFKAIGKYDSPTGPNYGLIRQSDPADYLGDWELTPQGKVYVHMSSFDQDVWHPVNKTFPAVEYSMSNTLGLAESLDPFNTSPIEISEFHSFASATWQFDVKNAGEHTVTLCLTGFGEPTRFNPDLQWFLMEGENEKALTEKFTPELPNSDTSYILYNSTVTLPAGHVKLKLKDVSGRPSGMHISTLRLTDAAGVENIALDVENLTGKIFNLQGICVGNFAEDWSHLPKGLYIVDGKKIAKSM